METVPVVTCYQATSRPGPKCEHTSTGVLDIGIGVRIITFKMRDRAAHLHLSVNSSEVNVRTCLPLFVSGIKHDWFRDENSQFACTLNAFYSSQTNSLL